MTSPPRLTASLVSWLLPAGPAGRSILGDLLEEFGERAATDPRGARRWFRREALAVAIRSRRLGRLYVYREPAPRGDSIMRTLMSEIRTALRVLRKQPRFTVVASITLALGIGATTAIFSVVNGILLQPLPYPQDEELVDVLSTAPGLGYDQFGLSADIFFFYKSESKAFQEMGLWARKQVNITGQGDPEQVVAVDAMHTYFTTLRVKPALGNLFGPDDDKPGAGRVALISDRLWRRRYAAKPDVVGQSIRLDDQPTTILGVMPRMLDEPNSADVWEPARLNAAQPPAGSFQWRAVGRLRPGVTAQTAESDLTPIVKRFAQERITSDDYRAFLANGRYRPLVLSMKESLIGTIRQPLWILFGTVGFVLLIACANVASLCLIRAEGRQREVAVRAALGARRGLLVRQFMVEALVLAAIGGTLGVAIAAAATPALLSLAPPTLPRASTVAVDTWALIFAAGTAAFSALVFGLVPAIRYTRTRAFDALRQGGRGSTDGRARQRGRQVLVVVQTAMALVLLVGSGLLARSFAHMMRADLGFRPADVLTFRVSLPATAYPTPRDVAQFETRLVERLGQVSGVQSAGGVSLLPLINNAPGSAYVLEGRPVQPGQLPPMIHYKVATPGYFDAMGMTLHRGRVLNAGDSSETARNIVINRAMVERFWPNEDPIGKRLRPSGAPDVWFTVVGVVDSERQNGIREAAPALMYMAPNGNPNGAAARTLTYLARGPAIESRAAALRAAVWELDPKLPIAVMRTLDEVVETSMLQFSFTTLTLGIAAGVALALGAVGLYGVLSYAVSLRIREIGVRLALGAQPGRVMRSIVARGAMLTGLGLVVGLAGAAALTRVLEGILFETKALDPLTFAAMSGVMAVVALLASYLPARKAASVSPLESLRAE
jgi:putative ABC transport system permease protein